VVVTGKGKHAGLSREAEVAAQAGRRESPGNAGQARATRGVH